MSNPTGVNSRLPVRQNLPQFFISCQDVARARTGSDVTKGTKCLTNCAFSSLIAIAQGVKSKGSKQGKSNYPPPHVTLRNAEPDTPPPPPPPPSQLVISRSVACLIRRVSTVGFRSGRIFHNFSLAVKM